MSALLLVALSVKGQFIDVDWNKAKRDSLLPICATVQPLPADYANYNYSARIEYPEFQLMSDDEIDSFGLRARKDELCAWPVIETSVEIAAKEPLLDISFLPVVIVDGKFMRINSYKLVVTRTPGAKRTARASSAINASRYAEKSVLSEGRWVKIRISESGVHQITHSELSKMGFGDPSRVRLFGYGGNILPEKNIHNIVDDLCEVPLWRTGDKVLFYANGPVSWSYSLGRYVHKQNVYSQYGYYFLTEGGEPKSFPVAPRQAESSVIRSTYPDYALYEKEEISLCHYGKVLLEGYNFTKGRTKSYDFDLPGITNDNMVVDVSFGSSADDVGAVEVNVNEKTVGTFEIPTLTGTDVGKIESARYNAPSLQNTKVTLVHKVAYAATSGYLDYIRLNFKRSLYFRAPQMNFRGSSTSTANVRFVISGAVAGMQVWKVSSPADICRLDGDFVDGNYSVTAAGSVNDEYVAVDVNATFPSPELVGDVPTQNLHALGQTDMVIIVPSNRKFIAPAERLAEAHRTMDGLTVAVVTADQVYNEFSSGTPDVTAYRRLMKMLYDRAADAAAAPKYLLLFGDGFVDNRMLSYKNRKPENFLLCYESDNSVSAGSSYVLEDYYGFLDDSEGGNHTRDKVDIGVGRFPVQSLSEANAVVDKTIAYMKNENAGAWQNTLSFLGDDGDKDIPNQHMIDAESVISVVTATNPSYIIDRIYWDNFEPVANPTGNSYPLVTAAIKKRLEDGALVVNYSGHGSANMFSHEMVWSAADMQTIKSSRLPFWVTASCDIGPFDMGDKSMGESALLNPNGGAVGLFTTTRTVMQNYNAIINREFMRVLLAPYYNGRRQAVGDAVRRGKNNVIALGSDLSENKLQFILLGDPALRLKLPEYGFVVEKMNGVDAMQSVDVSAGGFIDVEGYVSNSEGSVATDYTGVLTTTLYDSAEDLFTRDNLGLGVFEYTAYERKLFWGVDSVRNGRFKVTMPIPMDISYSGEKGLLSLFAVNKSKDILAQGRHDNFLIAGTATSNLNDGIGPEIKIYLNSSSFKDGDEVNSTPYLYAEFYDENGINTVGSSVGHDILLVVDNDADHTYNLNSLYEPFVGDYKRGSVALLLNELPAGEHKLILRAWDLFNNSSVTETTFVVVPGLAPDFINFRISPNPIRPGQTSQFVLTHNFSNSEMNAMFEVFNMQGEILWRSTETSTSDGDKYIYEWDGTTQSGQPLPTGLYLCRASLSSGESSYVSKTIKFIVVDNK